MGKLRCNHMATKRKRKPRKQSTPRLSTIAAKVLRQTKHLDPFDSVVIPVCHLRALAASVLSQDEIKGQGVKRG